MVSIETGNFLLWLHPLETIEGMFANKIATALIVDLLFVVVVFMVWSYREARKYDIKNVGMIWLLTFLFGLAGCLPLFLYLKEKKTDA